MPDLLGPWSFLGAWLLEFDSLPALVNLFLRVFCLDTSSETWSHASVPWRIPANLTTQTCSPSMHVLAYCWMSCSWRSVPCHLSSQIWGWSNLSCAPIYAVFAPASLGPLPGPLSCHPGLCSTFQALLQLLCFHTTLYTIPLALVKPAKASFPTLLILVLWNILSF